jgi:hypothetical protein
MLDSAGRDVKPLLLVRDATDGIPREPRKSDEGKYIDLLQRYVRDASITDSRRSPGTQFGYYQFVAFNTKFL